MTKEFTKITEFDSLDILTRACLENKFVPDNPSFRFCPGLFMEEAQVGKKRLINGVFGLERIDTETGEVLAVAGFKIENDEMIITHTPQGKRPDEFSSKRVRNRFGRSHFREKMMMQMIEIAKKLKLKSLIGYPAALYH